MKITVERFSTIQEFILRVRRDYKKESSTILVNVSGKMNDRHLSQHLSAKKEASDFKQLVDFREVGCMKRLTVRGVTEYAKHEPECLDSLLALVIPDSAVCLGMARAYQTFALEKRRCVEIFKNIDHAQAWLTGDELR